VESRRKIDRFSSISTARKTGEVEFHATGHKNNNNFLANLPFMYQKYTEWTALR